MDNKTMLAEFERRKAAGETIEAISKDLNVSKTRYYWLKKQLDKRPAQIHSFPISSGSSGSLRISGQPTELAKFLKELAVQFGNGGER